MPVLGPIDPRAEPAADPERFLVTIGIPTYDRPVELERAIRSALAQDHAEIEVLVSDNASPNPGVERVAARLTAGDPRLSYVRQPRNRGHAANYQWLLEHARGEYFMWLADDDWIDPHYVSRCLDVLVGDRGVILVCGLARYYENGAHVLDERAINLNSSRPGVRVLRYFGRVSLNGPMFGVVRREDLLPVGFPSSIGGDWLVIAILAAHGRVLTLGDVHIHRSLGGMGADPELLTRDLGISGSAARQPHMALAARIWLAIVHGREGFRSMRPPARLFVATAVAALTVIRFTLASQVRAALGAERAASLERRVSAWLRALDR